MRDALGLFFEERRRSHEELRDYNRDLERQVSGRTTELVRAKEAAEAANRSKSAFLAHMSHELRTPLNAILGFAQLVRRSAGVPPEQQENLEFIHRGGEHLLALINDVLEMSRIEAGHTALEETVFDLHELLSDLGKMFALRARDKGLQLLCERMDQVPRYAHADEGKLRQILTNLLSNAVKFTEEGGVSLRTNWVDGRLAIEVEDTGPGIAPQEQEALFDAFVQTNAGRQAQTGTGLGLAISQLFARLMGGQIEVQSSVGKGALFRVEMLIAGATREELPLIQTARRVVGLAPGQPEFRILVVEDQEENRLLMRQLLGGLGFAVREAVDGRDGIAQWEQWKPHLIWMDMRMPVMDGYEATRQIKKNALGQSTKVVALTASAFEEDRQKVEAAGCDDFVRKPFREEEIFAVLERHLGAHFVYEEEDEEAETELKVALTPDDLAVLPGKLVTALHQAASQADDKEIMHLLEPLEEERGELVAGLAKMARDFQFDELRALTQSAAG